jgi:hypothetical protein
MESSEHLESPRTLHLELGPHEKIAVYRQLDFKNFLPVLMKILGSVATTLATPKKEIGNSSWPEFC